MSERPLVISITAGTVVKAAIVVAVCALLYEIRDIVLIVLTAIVIASAIEPAVQSIARRRVPRVLSVMLVYIMLFAVLIAVFYFFLPSVANDLATFVASIPQYADAITHSSAFGQYGKIIGLSSDNTTPSDLLIGTLNAFDLRTYFVDPLSALTAVFGGVFSFLLIIVFSFYFAVIDTGVEDFLHIVTPKSYQPYVLGLWRRSQHKIGLWMQGQLLLGLIMGALVFLGLTILGVPHALVLAVITGLSELIPVFGVIFAGTVATAIAFATGGPTLGLLTVAFYVVAQQFESNLIYPLVVRRVVGVPPLLVIIALIVGGQIAGFLGIILSVPAAATIREFTSDYEAGKLGAQKEQ